MIKFYTFTNASDLHPTNQDFFTVPPNDENLVSKGGYLFTICDGVGGYEGGEIASKIAAKTLNQNYYTKLPQTNIKSWFFDNLIQINDKINKFGQDVPKYKGLATTIVAFLIKDNEGFAFNIGDSRLYKIFNRNIKQLSSDHSLVWERYKQGKIAKNEILSQPDKNIITEALGLSDKPKIDFASFKIKQGDIYFLCTDGVTDFLTDDSILKILLKYKNPKNGLKALYKKARENGSKDDITMIAVYI